MRLPTSTTVASAAAAAVVFTAASIQTLNPIFGIYDQTADELADLFNVDDVLQQMVFGLEEELKLRIDGQLLPRRAWLRREDGT